MGLAACIFMAPLAAPSPPAASGAESCRDESSACSYRDRPTLSPPRLHRWISRPGSAGACDEAAQLGQPLFPASSSPLAMEDDDLLGVMLDFGVRCSRSCRCAAAQRLPGELVQQSTHVYHLNARRMTARTPRRRRRQRRRRRSPPACRQVRLAADAPKRPAAAVASVRAAAATRS